MLTLHEGFWQRLQPEMGPGVCDSIGNFSDIAVFCPESRMPNFRVA